MTYQLRMEWGSDDILAGGYEVEIRLDDIRFDPDERVRPFFGRCTFRHPLIARFAELKASISAYGLAYPIVVARTDDVFELILEPAVGHGRGS